MITLDAASLISSLSTGSYSVVRTARGTFTNGIAVPGATSTFTIVAAAYQASGRDLQRLPEERRSVATKKIITTTRLLASAQAGEGGIDGDYQADLITIDGVVHEVQTVGRHPGAGGVDFYVCIAQAVG